MVDPPESYDKGDPIAGIGFKRIIGGGNEEELQVEKPSSAGPAAALMHAVTGADHDPSYANYAGALYHVTDFYRNRTPHTIDYSKNNMYLFPGYKKPAVWQGGKAARRSGASTKPPVPMVEREQKPATAPTHFRQSIAYDDHVAKLRAAGRRRRREQPPPNGNLRQLERPVSAPVSRVDRLSKVETDAFNGRSVRLQDPPDPRAGAAAQAKGSQLGAVGVAALYLDVLGRPVPAPSKLHTGVRAPAADEMARLVKWSEFERTSLGPLLDEYERIKRGAQPIAAVGVAERVLFMTQGDAELESAQPGRADGADSDDAESERETPPHAHSHDVGKEQADGSSARRPLRPHTAPTVRSRTALLQDSVFYSGGLCLQGATLGMPAPSMRSAERAASAQQIVPSLPLVNPVVRSAPCGELRAHASALVARVHSLAAAAHRQSLASQPRVRPASARVPVKASQAPALRAHAATASSSPELG